MKYRKRFAACVGACASVGLLASSAMGQNLRKCTDSDKIVGTQHTGGGGGGSSWDETSNISYGPITQIDVWAGGYVDGIQIKYGGVFGGRHGGGGGDYSSFKLDPGDNITQVSGRAGRYIDRICFQTERKPEATCYGGNGGDYFQAQSPGAIVVAFTGSAGDQNDSLNVVFGHQWRVLDGSFRYDSNALLNAVTNAPSEHVTQIFSNRSDVTQTYTYSKELSATDIKTLEWSKSETHAWKFGIDYTSGNSTTPTSAKISAEYSGNVTRTNGGSDTTQRSHTQAWSYPVTVPAHSQITATATWYNVPLNLDLKYTAVYFDNGTGQDICQEDQITRLQGVASTNVNVTLEQTSAKP